MARCRSILLAPLFALALALVAQASDEIATTPLWHFKPADHALGDVHPFFHEGECFLYSLKPGKYESVLARSTDLLQWRETPLTHDPVTPQDWMTPYFVLGVFRDQKDSGLFRSFYGHAEGGMVSSTSRDLLHWSCAPKEFHIPPADYYQRRRDPYVFWIPEMAQYGCVMTTWMKGQPKEKGGAISLATSADLKSWKDHGPLLAPGNIGEPECPQMFKMKDRWHLLASVYNRAVGRPVCWSAVSPLGPWKSSPERALDGKDLCAAQIAFAGEKALLLGWIPLTPAQPGKQSWGGHLALPREVHVHADGSLGTRLAPQMTETFARLPWVALGELTLSHTPRKINGSWQRLAAEFHLVMPDAKQETRINIEPLGHIAITQEGFRIMDARGECWSELPAELLPGTSMPIQIFVEGDLVELFADDSFSLAARVPLQSGKLSLSLETDGPTASVSQLRVSEWSRP